MRDQRHILIGSQKFDPAQRGAPSNPTPAIGAVGEPSPYVVQLRRVLQQNSRNLLQSRYNLRLDDYVPNNAYVEQIYPDQFFVLQRDSLIRAIVPYEAAFKIASGLDGSLESTAFSTKTERLLRVVLFQDASIEAVADDVRQSGGLDVRVQDDRGTGGVASLITQAGSLKDVRLISRMPGVRWIEPIVGKTMDNTHRLSAPQPSLLGASPIWNPGLHGENQIVGVIDTVVDVNHCWFRDIDNPAPGPSHRKLIALRNLSQSEVGSHGTFVCGILGGDNLNCLGSDPNRGGAWAARISFSNHHDVPGIHSLLSYLTAAAGDGARIHTNSWHESPQPAPQYNQTAAEVDTFVWYNEDNLVLGSSGNVGESIGPPGTAKNALCISAARVRRNVFGFGDGNSGPTLDARPRRKPELCAPGCAITSARADTSCLTTTETDCASSWATAGVAGAAALVRQYFMEGWYPTGAPQAHDAFVPSGALMKAILLNSALNMGTAGDSGGAEGWGLLALDRTLMFAGGSRDLLVWDTRNALGLKTSETRMHHAVVARGTQTLKMTLVWTEPPAPAGAADPVVNDLDLVVTDPHGRATYHGNCLSEGFSTQDGISDSVNNVEMVILDDPTPGEWAISVNAVAVNVGNPGQGFALVVSADVASAATVNA